jgi:hypothetical protein
MSKHSAAKLPATTPDDAAIAIRAQAWGLLEMLAQSMEPEHRAAAFLEVAADLDETQTTAPMLSALTALLAPLAENQFESESLLLSANIRRTIIQSLWRDPAALPLCDLLMAKDVDGETPEPGAHDAIAAWIEAADAGHDACCEWIDKNCDWGADGRERLGQRAVTRFAQAVDRATKRREARGEPPAVQNDWARRAELREGAVFDRIEAAWGWGGRLGVGALSALPLLEESAAVELAGWLAARGALAADRSGQALEVAAAAGKTELCRALMQMGARASEMAAPLAARSGNVETLELFDKAGFPWEKAETALSAAISGFDPEKAKAMAQKILTRRASQTALWLGLSMGARTNHVWAMDAIEAAGLKLPWKVRGEFCEDAAVEQYAKKTKFGFASPTHPLREAAKNGQLAAIQWLQARGEAATGGPDVERLALQAALKENKTECAMALMNESNRKWLLDGGAPRLESVKALAMRSPAWAGCLQIALAWKERGEIETVAAGAGGKGDAAESASASEAETASAPAFGRGRRI